jgi:MFS family permease
MQIPLALALDKWGARRIIGLCALVCGFATWMFVLVPSWPAALISRFLIGTGSVVGFLGASKIVSQWFPGKHYGRLIGLTFSFGLLGAVYGGRPISQWIAQLGWEQVCLILGWVAVIISGLCLLFLRENSTLSEEKPYPFFKAMKTLLNNKAIITLGIANLLMVGTLEGFADVWGVSYLMAAKSITKAEASGITSYIFIGMLFGGPILAYLSEKWNAPILVTHICGVLMGFILIGILMLNPYCSLMTLKGMMFVLGIFCCYQVIVFSIGSASVPKPLINVTIAFLNCINMLGGFFFHTLIGRLMDYFQDGSVSSVGYASETYAYALFVIPVASIVGAFLMSRVFALRHGDLALMSKASTSS